MIWCDFVNSTGGEIDETNKILLWIANTDIVDSDSPAKLFDKLKTQNSGLKKEE